MCDSDYIKKFSNKTLAFQYFIWKYLAHFGKHLVILINVFISCETFKYILIHKIKLLIIFYKSSLK